MTNMDIFFIIFSQATRQTWYPTGAYHLSALVKWTQQLIFDAIEWTRTLILMNLEERKRIET